MKVGMGKYQYKKNSYILIRKNIKTSKNMNRKHKHPILYIKTALLFNFLPIRVDKNFKE